MAAESVDSLLSATNERLTITVVEVVSAAKTYLPTEVSSFYHITVVIDLNLNNTDIC